MTTQCRLMGKINMYKTVVRQAMLHGQRRKHGRRRRAWQSSHASGVYQGSVFVLSCSHSIIINSVRSFKDGRQPNTDDTHLEVTLVTPIIGFSLNQIGNCLWVVVRLMKKSDNLFLKPTVAIINIIVCVQFGAFVYIRIFMWLCDQD